MKRIQLLDLWRTVAIVCMLVYHFLYDLALLGIMSWDAFFSPGLDALQLFICCSFILLSGVSSRFSRSNLRRGLVTLGAAVVVSIGAYVAGQPILFGVLHFLGCAMLIYGLVGKYIQKLPKLLAPALFVLLFAATKLWTASAVVDVKFLFPLGFVYDGFWSADYFPLMPWLFLFLLGSCLGGLLADRQWKWLRAEVPACLTWPGRHSLLIYILHQPVLYGLALLISRS